MSTRRWFFAVLLCGLAFGPVRASDIPDSEVITIRTPLTRIQVVAVSPRLINDGLVDTTIARQSSSGLPVVGLGEQVYVAAAVGALRSVTTFNWFLTPPSGSSAVLGDAPQIGKTFTPDVAGDYLVTLGMTHAGGDTVLTQTITAARYVGADRCGQCHPAAKSEWEKTAHASAMTSKMKGLETGGFQERCIKCHSVSGNTSAKNPTPGDSDSFTDRARDLGWTFPTLRQGTWEQVVVGQTPSGDAHRDGVWTIDLKNSAWDAMPAELRAMSNVQCENCHGPGSAHVAGGFAQENKKIGKSLDQGVCAKCHDDGHYHVRPHEWESSAHGKVWSRDYTYAGGSCAQCHLGSGFIARKVKGEALTAANFESGVTQSCATCHDPHGTGSHDKQVRFAGQVTLRAMVAGQTGIVSHAIDLGKSATCAQCHVLRAGRDVPGQSVHHSHQTEILAGVGGYHYPNETYISGAHKFMDSPCTTCHMAIPARTDARSGKLGSHTWGMYDDNGTPDNPSDDLYNTIGCTQCHGPLQNFDVNGARTEVLQQMNILAGLLPRLRTNANTVAHTSSVATRPMTEAEVNAAFNYLVLEGDGSHGIHNYKYARKLLADAIVSLRPATPAPLAGDFNGDGRIDFADLFMFTAQFGKSTASADWDVRYDLSNNGVIGFTDWLVFLDNFGKSTAAGKPVLVNNGRNANGDIVLVGSNRPSIDQEHLGVTVQALNMAELRGYGVYISYDPNALEFVRAVRTEGGLLPIDEKTALAVQVLEPGRVMVADATVGNSAASGTGALADLIFRRLGPAGQASVQIDLAQMADLNFGLNAPGAPAPAVAAPSVYALIQNFPNPFNPATTIRYSLAEPGEVKIAIFNALGQEVRTLVDHYKLAGEYSAQWDARDNAGREVASGVYMYQMQSNGFAQTMRMVLMR